VFRLGLGVSSVKRRPPLALPCTVLCCSSLWPLIDQPNLRAEPILVKPMMPKWASSVRCTVLTFTVNTMCGMRAWSSLWCSWVRWHSRGVSPAATGECAMVGLGMRTRALRTAWGLRAACLGGVSPLPAMLTERSAEVGSSSAHKARCGPDLERSANQVLSHSAQLRISDIEPHGGGVRAS
jgi:hypothetical protein